MHMTSYVIIVAAVFFAAVFALQSVELKVNLELTWREAVASAFDRLFLYPYRMMRMHYRDWRCSRARQYLLKYDQAYRWQHASLELVRRRNAFYGSGGSAASRNCPEIEDVLNDPKFTEK
jgi:hypothetical protein